MTSFRNGVVSVATLKKRNPYKPNKRVSTWATSPSAISGRASGKNSDVITRAKRMTHKTARTPLFLRGISRKYLFGKYESLRTTVKHEQHEKEWRGRGGWYPRPTHPPD